MKRRSFLALALTCLGVKFLPKAKAVEPVVVDIRMDEAGDTARQWLSDRLWYQTRETSFDELV